MSDLYFKHIEGLRQMEREDSVRPPELRLVATMLNQSLEKRLMSGKLQPGDAEMLERAAARSRGF